MRKISVELGKNGYDVHIGRGLLARAGAFIVEALAEPAGSMLVVSSPKVWRLWGRTLERGLKPSRIGPKVILIPDGEPKKNIHAVGRLMGAFLRAGADRQTAVVAFGGGVIGDIAGFAASIYMRGIPVIQIPTTLLAQVDAAIGGKTGVNLREGKNLAGTFHQPRLVLCDITALATLPEREYRAGLFEVIKCGVIRDPKLFRRMESETRSVVARRPDAMEAIVRASVAVKASVVKEDERESDLRRILNFGHTIGHALETATHYRRFLHGEAVGLGMIAAAEIGVAARVTPPEVAARIVDTVMAYGPFPAVECTARQVLRHVAADKKVMDGVPRFVLATAIGKTKIVSSVSSRMVADAVRSLRELTRRGRR